MGCQATVVVKKVSTIIRRRPTNLEDSANSDFENDDDNQSMDTNSIYSENSDIDGWANSGETESIKSENSDVDGLQDFGRTNSISSDIQELDIQEDAGSIEHEDVETCRPMLTTSN